ncbi:hypothetical protein GGQ79_001736 [Ochrobactrum pecoris]|uniref:Transposase n=1 Tax=Brucella pecoris TaxID=867683 RepID=A0AB34YPQ2_9HYPH|nr:hypothetical protein [Brucella pecoris]
MPYSDDICKGQPRLHFFMEQDLAATFPKLLRGQPVSCDR